ncbi:MAG: hypothetical protein GC191_18995 [Azospirillum sp.]|nr:hypothetical protein [Azospirillum sp.]
MSDLRTIIAQAIRGADRSMFNEDYGKQADAVIQTLRKAGYELLPVRPSPGLIEHVNENLPIGRLRPSELVSTLYSLILQSARRFDK